MFVHLFCSTCRFFCQALVSQCLVCRSTLPAPQVPIEKVFAKTLINKFPWALDIDPAFRFQRSLDPTASLDTAQEESDSGDETD